MWSLAHELERHFDAVKERRKSGSSDSDEPIEGPMIRNEHARGRGREAALSV
jgi:hypothetical protein